MTKTPGGFRAALLIGWIVLGAAGILYARSKNIPGWTAWPVLAAFLFEYPFYLLPGFPDLRDRFAGRRLPLLLAGSAVIPYLVCCLGGVEFQWGSLLRVGALALAIALWYVVLPVNIAVDLGFLALFATVLLSGYLDPVYKPVYPPFKDIKVLGHLALIHMSVLALLLERRIPDPGYSFIPNRREWKIGALFFVAFLAVGLPLGYLLGAVRAPHTVPPWKVVAQFLGFLWVVSLSEEFLTRGVLMQWIEDWTSSTLAALLTTSLVFGLVHLWFGDAFPNYRWLALASVLGLFCGLARLRGGSVRAAAVTHSLVITAYLFIR